ncbi:MAG: hypothetical protein LAO03_19380 [Acidobacteriia bacterium]|nr:hypothetical protein [Terriglobia bacterium]
MRNAMFIMLIATLVLSGVAIAQQDILGPHNLQGHGCATCHAPHTGAQGLGGKDASTGVNYLWGRDFFPNTYTTFGNGTLVTLSSYSSTDVLFHTGACLACHDGNVTVAGMTGQTFETVNGVQVPSYLNKDGYSLTNDHPVHVPYVPGSRNWPGSVDVNGNIVWDTTDSYVANFYNTYGHPARLYGVPGNSGPSIECSSCHNPHATFNTQMSTGNKTVLYVKTAMFVRGWYDEGNANSNSATQFCRSCHYSKSNEYAHVNSTTK